MHQRLRDLQVKIFADGGDLADFADLVTNPLIAGVTTNPTLMRQAGVHDYVRFGQELLELTPDHLAVSFEVFADELGEIEEQAVQIASWGRNVYVKVPITNTRGESCLELAESLATDGVQLNVTACTTTAQVLAAGKALAGGPKSFVSLFAGRVADSGRDPVQAAKQALDALAGAPNVSLIWASPREVFNIFQADAAGCHVITVTKALLEKLHLVGRDLDQVSIDTVRMFRHDAVAAGYSLDGVRAPE